MLDTNIVAVALPSIASGFGARFADMQWVVTAYMLAFASLLMAAGAFGDLYGRRRALVLGQVIFALASLACGLAVSPTMLNISRAVQGIGASLLLTAALAIINHTYRGTERTRAYAFWGASLGGAITLGPLIGGVLSSTVGWRWAFLVNLPVCTVLVAATIKYVPESRDPDAQRPDYLGVATFSAALLSLIWGVIGAGALGWSTPATLARLTTGLVLMALFILVEWYQVRPMFDLALFRSNAFLGSACAQLGYAAGAQVMLFYLPLYLQNMLGFSAIATGFAMLPFALPMFAVPRFGAHLATRFTTRALLCTGLALATAANMCMALMASTGVSYPVFAFAMALAGAGAGILNGESSKAMQGAVPPSRAGMASGISGTVRFVGLLFGVAGLGAMLSGVAVSSFVQSAGKYGLGAGTARSLIQQFAAGDAHGAYQGLPEALRNVLGAGLRTAFSKGYCAVALSSATIALLALVMARCLMPSEAPMQELPAPDRV